MNSPQIWIPRLCEKWKWTFQKTNCRCVLSCSGSYSLVFGCNCIWQRDKYRVTKSPPLLSFSPCQQLNHYSVAAFLFHHVTSASSGWKKKKKSVFLCTSRNTIHTKLRPKCEFPAFCEAVHVAASNGRQHCLKKIMCFFPPWFLLSKGSEPFSQKHKRCAVREANGSICPDRVFFSSAFFLFSLLWLTEKALSGI